MFSVPACIAAALTVLIFIVSCCMIVAVHTYYYYLIMVSYRGPPAVTCCKLGHFGRLGNQLFQLAAVQTVATAKGARPVLPMHVTSLPIYSLFDMDFFTYTDARPTHFYEDLGATTSAMPPHTLQRDMLLNLHGYFQHIRFAMHPPLLRLRPTYQSVADNYAQHIGVHVRRGDYVNLKDLFHPLSPSYYKKALHLAAKQFKEEFPLQIIVCSDDIEWCKKALNLDERAEYLVEYSSSTDELQDFSILAGCRALIISNSSFSWWAAQYGPKQLVIMPWPWFTEGGDLDEYNDKNALKLPGWKVLQLHK